MIGSRADGRLRRAALAALMALTAGTAWAQTVKPLPLAPPTSLLGTPGEAPAEPEATAPAAPDEDIRIEGLEAVAPEAVGTLGPSDGGLGIDMWQGTDRALVETLLPRLPSPVTGRVAHDLARRLLLTTAKAPVGEARGDTSLVALRAERLAALGDVAPADRLLAASSRRLEHAAEARVSIRLRLLQYDFAGACTEVSTAALPFDDAFAQQVLVFCQALNGEAEQVSFGLDLLRDLGEAPDPAFARLVEGLANEAPPDEAPAVASALNLAVLHAAGKPVPAGYAAARDPAILRTVALTANVPDEARLIATQRAEAAGAIDTAALGQRLAAIELAADEMADPLAAATPERGVRALALLYLAARSEVVPAARAEVLRRLWQLARELDAYPGAARLGAPLLVDMAPAAELAWAAGDMARVLLATGQPDAALDWYRAAQREAPFDPEAATIDVDLWPLMRLAHGTSPEPEVAAAPRDVASAEAVTETVEATASDVATTEVAVAPLVEEDVPWSDARLVAWLDARADAEAVAAGRQADLLAGLFGAFRDPAGDAAWRALLNSAVGWEGASAPSAVSLGMGRAATAGRVAETILLALIVLGEDGLAGLNPAALKLAIEALVQVGLTEEARALAVEAALAAGL